MPLMRMAHMVQKWDINEYWVPRSQVVCFSHSLTLQLILSVLTYPSFNSCFLK